MISFEVLGIKPEIDDDFGKDLNLFIKPYIWSLDCKYYGYKIKHTTT